MDCRNKHQPFTCLQTNTIPCKNIHRTIDHLQGLVKEKERPADNQLLKFLRNSSGFLCLSRSSLITQRVPEILKRHIALQRYQIKCKKVLSLVGLALQFHLMVNLSWEELLLIYSQKRARAVSMGCKLICQKFNLTQEKRCYLKI